MNKMLEFGLKDPKSCLNIIKEQAKEQLAKIENEEEYDEQVISMVQDFMN